MEPPPEVAPRAMVAATATAAIAARVERVRAERMWHLLGPDGTLAVDRKTIATGTAPPEGTYDGPTVPVETVDPAPSIALYGPETVKLSKRAKTVRLVVFSSGEGHLEVNLGANALGKRVLRAGNNDVRFTLPRGAAARRLYAARNVLTVTSLSSAGTRGATISRKLVFTK